MGEPNASFEMMNNFLTSEQLKEKKEPGILELLRASFEYLLAGACKEHSKIKDFSNIREFNDKNELTFASVLAYPFFVSTSNGHAKQLYSLFGDFYALSFGPISFSVLSSMQRDKDYLRYFSVDLTATGKGVKVIKTDFLDKDFVELKNRIKADMIAFEENKIQLESVFIEGDEDQPPIRICDAIDKGISAIEKQSRKTFFDGDLESITFQSKYFSAFRRALKGGVSNKMPDYEKIENPDSRPFFVYS